MPSMSRTSSSQRMERTQRMERKPMPSRKNILGWKRPMDRRLYKVYPPRSQWRSFNTVRLRFENTYTSPFKGSRWQERMAPHRLSTPLRRNHAKSAVFHVKLQGSNFASSSSLQSVLRLASAYSSHLSGFTWTISQLPNREYMTALSTAPSSVLLKR